MIIIRWLLLWEYEGCKILPFDIYVRKGEHTPRHIAEVQSAFKDLMIREDMQFALRIAFRCVFHRYGNQGIRC